MSEHTQEQRDLADYIAALATELCEMAAQNDLAEIARYLLFAIAVANSITNERDSVDMAKQLDAWNRKQWRQWR